MDKSNAIMETFEAKKKEVADNINKNIKKLEKKISNYNQKIEKLLNNIQSLQVEKDNLKKLLK